ncbi:type II toxin-antitoxin system BrnA family antitoxin [Maridesulfovibrio sp.]|uniref:type II toxin-antitoxin system BrnA family antitoxin n=1 Tax=Maridesulfovibrio sp. TaxID=2795000 RepID=UPI002A189D93|nr:CopG family transcriptional regulator [Maridesulfovibrio sp.]
MKTTADNLEQKFDEGEEVLDFFDLDSANRLNTENKRVNVDFPAWMVIALDREAKRLGINRQAVIKTWIANRIDRGHSPDA